MQTSLKLETIRQLTETTQLARNDAGLEFLVVIRPDSEAIISLFGAHLIHFAPKNQSPWFWLSREAVLDGSRGIRGGVPICWPWFGPSPERVGFGKVQHGFARTSVWQLDGISDAGDGTLLHLSLQENTLYKVLYLYHLQGSFLCKDAFSALASKSYRLYSLTLSGLHESHALQNHTPSQDVPPAHPLS